MQLHHDSHHRIKWNVMSGYDPLTKAERSERMSRIRSSNTKPELFVRRLIYGMGYRYRLHARDLPGKPDIVFRSRKKVVFVHGCFWHQHGCGHYRQPKSQTYFWQSKLEQNKSRDLTVSNALRKQGWKLLIIWECQLKSIEKLKTKIRRFLEPTE